MKFRETPPGTVARTMQGTAIRKGKAIGVILTLEARDAKHCGRFATVNPVLRAEKPADAAVVMYRGRPMLFIGTQPGTCIQVNSMLFQGKRVSGAQAVCKALGLEEGEYAVETDGTVTRLRKPKKEKNR